MEGGGQASTTPRNSSRRITPIRAKQTLQGTSQQGEEEGEGTETPTADFQGEGRVPVAGEAEADISGRLHLREVWFRTKPSQIPIS